MPRFLPEELSKWVSSPWKNGFPGVPITGISHDTRTLEPGNLYVAIRGENHDGHQFLHQAFERGAVGVLVARSNLDIPCPFLRVADTLDGLWALARGYRKKWQGTVVGITGSVGKTTVKEMCAAVLATRGATHATSGNFNNHIGLPLTMLAMPEDAAFGVFEIGMNHPGEIAPLAQLLQPEIGILADIGAAHQENFQSLEGIAREKAQLIEQLPPDGLALLDRGSEWFALLSGSTRARIRTFAIGGPADYSGRETPNGELEVNGFSYAMPLPGRHIARNALRAIALGLELGIEPPRIAEALLRFKLPPMRWEETETGGIRFINDAYNANPLSMRASLETFARLPGNGKKWVVVGGMRELGASAEKEHARLGRLIDRLGFDGAIAVGKLARSIQCEGGQPFFHTLEPAEAADILKRNLLPGDRVLLKASRGERLERVLEHLKANQQPPTTP